jgi:GT2 family glycosyltransferase
MRLSENETDIVVSVHNRYTFTRGLIEGIYRYTDSPFHLYVIDNASTDETTYLDKIYTRNITVVRNHRNTGWSAGVNQGLALGNSPNVVFMNDGAEVSKNWLENILAFMNTHPRIGAVGPLGSSPGDWQYLDRVREKVVPQIPVFQTGDIHERNRILQYHFYRAGILIKGMLSFFCVALKRRTITGVGRLNETLAFSEASTDYCRRLRKAGYVLGLALDTYVVSHSNEQITSMPDAAASSMYMKQSA